MSVMSHFSQNLKKLREEAGLTQTQMAEQLGISRGSISFYENGDRVPDIEVLARVSDRFQVSTDWLLGITKARTTDDAVKVACNYTGLTEEAIRNIHGLYQQKIEIEMNISKDFCKIDMLSLLLSGHYYFPLDGILKDIASYPFRVGAIGRGLHKLLAIAKKSYDDGTLNKLQLERECNNRERDFDVAEFELYRSAMVIIDTARELAKKEIADVKETMEELQDLYLYDRW